MKTYNVIADIGSISIESAGVCFHVSNGHGDGHHRVIVTDKRLPTEHAEREKVMPGFDHFVTSFNVHGDAHAFLRSYDCGGERIHEFERGRWFVSNNKKGDVLVERLDDYGCEPLKEQSK